MRPILILMWKHCIIRRRRYIQTLLEMISTIVAVLCLFFARSAFRAPIDMDVPIMLREEYPLQSIPIPSMVYFTPVTRVTQLLMEKVKKKLGLSEIYQVPEHSFNANSRELRRLTDKMGDSDALVIFQNSNDFQETLNYTIQRRSNFRRPLTNTNETTSTINERFLRLQWAIDTSFLERRNGTEIIKNITFHEVATSDDKKKDIGIFLLILAVCFCSRFSLYMPFMFLMMRYIEEKVTGHLEMIKMYGVNMRTVNFGHFLNMLPTGLFHTLVLATLMKITSTSMVPKTNFFLIALPLFLNFYAVMQWALLCSFVVNKPSYTMAISSFMYLLICFPGLIIASIPLGRIPIVFLGACFPLVPFDKFFTELASLESEGKGITISNMWSRHTKVTMAASDCVLCTLVQFWILCFLVWQLNRMRPGPYGIPRSYFTRSLDEDISALDRGGLDHSEPMPRDPKYFEDTHKNKEVGIKIVNVSKVYGYGTKRFQALSNVSFDIQRGEIIVLLGQNGAGKTTLLSIITGMIPATAGKIYVNGYDIEKSKPIVRKDIGYCTQHEMFIPNLTVLEQVRFFSMLKGLTLKESEKKSGLLLEELGLRDGAHCKSQQLSGGMKRRLQLACALAGGSTVLVLDEPTSGLDVETRRQLWDLLLGLRGDRTMLLTTHHLEEADALADRVAALHQGMLRCHATPAHLKHNVGSGYRLKLMMTRGAPREAEITPIVTLAVSGASFKDKSLKQVSYDLPTENTAQFPALFKELEEKQVKLDIESIGVSMSSLEEVFLRLFSNIDTDITEDTALSGIQMAVYEKLSGFALLKSQASILIKRHYYYMYETLSRIIGQITIIFILIFCITYGTFKAKINNNDNQKLRDYLEKTISPLKLVFDTEVLFPEADNQAVEGITNSLEDVKFTESSYVEDALNKGTTQSQLYHNDNYLAGLSLNSTHAKITYRRGMYDAASITLNHLSNALAAGQLGGTRRVIQTNHNPIVTTDTRNGQSKPQVTIELSDQFSVVFMVVLASGVVLISAADILKEENLTGTRNIYIMSGCSVTIFWTVRLVYFFILYTMMISLPLLIALNIFKVSRMIWTIEPLAVLMLTLGCGCCAWLSLIFLIGLNPSELFVTVSINLNYLLGITLGTLAMFTAILDVLENMGSYEIIVKLITYFITPATFAVALGKASQVALANAYCEVNRHLCPTLVPAKVPFDLQKCCIEKKQVAEYFSFSVHSPLLYILLLILQFFVMMLFIILIEKGWFHKKCIRMYKPKPAQFTDPLVRNEKQYVEETFAKPKKDIQDVMLVKDLHKKIFLKKTPIVRGVSFSVKQGECFGVMGMNGAGKSTTFRMIVGETSSSHGSIFANKHFLNTERQAYLRSLSYCPQFLGLDTYMTGYQNLRTRLTIRGLNERDVQAETNLCFDAFGLQRHKHKKVCYYSGGCMRRLAVGTALCSGAAVTLLDEPSSGVDMLARNRIWALIERSLHEGRAVVISSNSMDEMETLSNRLMIMARGEVRLLGSPGALRASHAACHAVTLKLAPTAHDGAVAELKAAMNRTFNCTLKDEHATLLRFHINRNRKNSELFLELENLKAKSGGLIENYSVSATSLEEVFLAVAQETSSD